jgi:hypothetical protein
VLSVCPGHQVVVVSDVASGTGIGVRRQGWARVLGVWCRRAITEMRILSMAVKKGAKCPVPINRTNCLLFVPVMAPITGWFTRLVTGMRILCMVTKGGPNVLFFFQNSVQMSYCSSKTGRAVSPSFQWRSLLFSRSMSPKPGCGHAPAHGHDSWRSSAAKNRHWPPMDTASWLHIVQIGYKISTLFKQAPSALLCTGKRACSLSRIDIAQTAHHTFLK